MVTQSRFPLGRGSATRPLRYWVACRPCLKRMILAECGVRKIGCQLFFLFVLGLDSDLGIATSRADEPAAEPFAEAVTPFITQYCSDCHSADEPQAGLNLLAHPAPAVAIQDAQVWEKVLKMLADQEMPPETESQPPASEVEALRSRVKAELARLDCEGQSHPGRVTIRRLNRAEYNNTIRDLVGIDFQPAVDFPADDVGAGFDNIGDVLSLPPLLLEKYLAAAEQIVQRAFQDPAARPRILVCDPRQAEGDEKLECVRRILQAFVTRAFRRPPEPDEVRRLLDLGLSAWQNGADEDEALQVVFQAVLVSPHFLFRVEADPEADDPDGIRDLNDYELACRLSYFLWSSMPDETLFTLAQAGKLREPGVIREQVQRMLHDDKAVALVKNFAGQWLQLRDVAKLTPDPQLFPNFDEALRNAMLRETELFFETVIREDRSLLDFLNADFSFVNERLARHYGLSGPVGDEFQRVTLNDQRRGVLTHASILLLTSNPTRTSPVKRGKWILENFLDDPPPPPLPGVQTLEEQQELLGSLRERMEQHRSDPNCAVCHKRMDALGFGLENFDAIGAWRDADGKFPISPAGSLPGNLSFSGPKELMQVLQEHKQEDFCRCLARKMLTYALGRELNLNDYCTVNAILKRLAEEEYRFSSLVLAIVTSDPFTKRAAPAR